MCVCLSVCLSVCVISTAQTDEPILLKLSTNDVVLIFDSYFFRGFPNFELMTAWRPFCILAFWHSHGRNFAPIFFKFELKVLLCRPVFAIGNHQDRLITTGDRENSV